MLHAYFKGLYERTMRESYGLAHREIFAALQSGGSCLDCGANSGFKFDLLREQVGLGPERYHGIEWSAPAVAEAQARQLNVIQGDLNRPLPFADGQFRCVYALSLVEHLLNPCRFLREANRVLAPGGTLVILTPNISTYFTAALILLGKMPSSGPHPDSDQLLQQEELFRVRPDHMHIDAEEDMPVHRHIVVFSYRVLHSYLQMLGFEDVHGHGFGLYPFPNFLQPVLEKIDPWHCHQMVFVARKPG
jgi:SAM-dependent methyltransferase